MKPIILTCAFLIMICGCASTKFKESYQPTGEIPPTDAPDQIEVKNRVDADVAVEEAKREGYRLLGVSSFMFEGNFSPDLAKRQAKRCNASLVIVKHRPTGYVNPVFATSMFEYTAYYLAK